MKTVLEALRIANIEKLKKALELYTESESELNSYMEYVKKVKGKTQRKVKNPGIIYLSESGPRLEASLVFEKQLLAFDFNQKKHSPIIYALEYQDTEEILGYYISNYDLVLHGLEESLAPILFEMTFLGFGDDKENPLESIDECIEELGGEEYEYPLPPYNKDINVYLKVITSELNRTKMD